MPRPKTKVVPVSRSHRKRFPKVPRSEIAVCQMALWKPQFSPEKVNNIDNHIDIVDPLTRAILLHEPLPALHPWWNEAVEAARQPTPVILKGRPALEQVVPSTLGSTALSSREREILILLAEGHSNKAIAERLIIAETTVKWYVKQIFLKLGVHSRTQAIARLHQM